MSGLSRRLGRGSGSVIGGRAILAIEPAALQRLAADHDIALVSGTNGKTTTTSLLAAALGSLGPVVTNLQGANLPPGLATALAAGPPGGRAALEVDEAWLRRVVAQTEPKVVVLLNLSRDQLDRNNEVRRLARSWRDTFSELGSPHVVANADDPLVVWGAGDADDVTWVGAGQPWTADASACPACGGRLVFDAAKAAEPPDTSGHPASAEGWVCLGCSRRRPPLAVWVEGDEIVTRSGDRHRLGLRLPGRCNLANAAMALAGAERLGAEPRAAVAAMDAVGDVGGRYRTATIGAARARLLLAKNPAGWLEVFDLLAPPPGPVVVAINARIADGRDPSWLWDVPFERLQGRPVVATGDRSRDLAVRLRYADVEHRRIDDVVAAVAAAAPATGSAAGPARRRRRGGQLHRVPGPAPADRPAMSTVGIGLVYPDLLGTYGDGGNATILAQRLRWRGQAAEVITVLAGDAVPDSCELYMVGGGEDVPQVSAARELLAARPLHRAVEAGAAVLAVCAGLQICGTSFMAGDEQYDGLGLLDCRSVIGHGPRAVGELVVEPEADLPTLTGYENHAGVTVLGESARPNGRVVSGVGNGDGSHNDGAVAGRVYGTYLHGPVLARNPALADLLLGWALGPLAPLDDSEAEELRRERLRAARTASPDGVGRTGRGRRRMAAMLSRR